MDRSILLFLPPKKINNSNNNTSDDMARLHTYVHTYKYMHTRTNLPSPVLSASMRDGVVVKHTDKN
jgi:hypothetical protein